MADREKVIKGLEACEGAGCIDCVYYEEEEECELNKDILELLKEQEKQERKWLQTISDNQLSIGGADPLTDYEQGLWDGLQMAYEILAEED